MRLYLPLVALLGQMALSKPDSPQPESFRPTTIRPTTTQHTTTQHTTTHHTTTHHTTTHHTTTHHTTTQPTTPTAAPTLDPLDERFMDWRPPGPDDVRSPCPAINCIANHGFINRSGKDVSLLSLMLGLFLGIGVSPEASGIVGAFGLVSSDNPLSLVFDLDNLAKHMFFIEHDNSFSRNDARVGDNNAFNMTVWNVALRELIGHDTISPFRMGRAKSARVEANKELNPASVYGPHASLIGAIDTGLFLGGFGFPIPGFVQLEHVRSVFEEERLPYHLGWRPIPFACNLASFLGFAGLTLLGDPKPVTHGIDFLLGVPSDIIQMFVPPELDFLAELRGMVRSLGFEDSEIAEVESMMRKSRTI